MSAIKSVQVIPGDIKPRHEGKRRTYMVSMSRSGLGRFLRSMLWREGYFVTAAQLRLRTRGRGVATARYTDPKSGTLYTGVIAWSLLAEKAMLTVNTLQKLVNGEHRRSPELFTVCKVFRALALDIKAIESDDDNVEMVVSGW